MSQAPAAPGRLRGALLRWGLPRDPDASRHLTGFLVATVLTVLVTRGALAVTGFPQVGGEGLHVSHVLWGGLLMGLALVISLSFLGPVARPFVVLVAGVGFGLFVDEVGKFVTDDYDYFYGPTAMLVYVSVVVLALVGEALAGSRPAPSERLAAAVDQAVAGVAGGFSPRVREHAETLLADAQGAPGYDEAAALVAVVRPDRAELPDPVAAVSRAVVGTTRRLVRASWVPRLAVVAIVGVAVLAVVRGLWLPDEDASTWVSVMLVAGGVGTVVACVVGLVVVGGDRERAFRWFRRAVLVSLLVTEVALLRLDQWAGFVVLAVDLVLLGLVAAELDVLQHERRAGDRQTGDRPAGHHKTHDAQDPQRGGRDGAPSPREPDGPAAGRDAGTTSPVR